MELRYILAFLTLISSTNSANHEISNKSRQPVPVDFYRVLLRGVENPHAELRSPVLIVSGGSPNEQDIQINVPKITETRRRNQNSRIGKRPVKKTKRNQLHQDLDPHQLLMTSTNWTSCAELDRRPRFHPEMVIDVDWVPVYAWSLDGVDNFVHRFKVPEVNLVAHYRHTFGKYLSSPIDWNQPRLLLTMLVMEKLLIAEGRRGKFKVIEKFEMPEDGLGTPVMYDADEEKIARRALREQEADLEEKKKSVLKGDFPYNGGSGEVGQVQQGGSSRKITATGTHPRMMG